MSKSSLVVMVSLFLAFASGIGLGLLISHPSSFDVSGSGKTAVISSPLRTSASETEISNSLLESRIIELEKELENQKKNQDALIMEDRLALFKRHCNDIHAQTVFEDLKVSPTMADILKLSPQEQQALEQHLKEIQDETRKLEDAKLVLVKQAGNTVTYQIPAYADEGGKEIKAKLNSLLSADIGDARAEFFMNNSQYTFASQFSNFGEQKTQIEITRTDQAGPPSYKLKESYFTTAGASSSTLERTIDTLPSRYEKLLQIDPAP